jgi:DNA-binding MarR family transcriptional regulator
MSASSDLRPDEYGALAELRYQIRHFLAFSEAAALQVGLEPQQHQLLLILKALSPQRPTVRAIAERLHIKQNSAAELVRRSVERGVVDRQTGEHDRREVSLGITRRGAQLLHKLSISHRAELRAAAPTLLHAIQQLLSGDSRRAAKGRPSRK